MKTKLGIGLFTLAIIVGFFNFRKIEIRTEKKNAKDLKEVITEAEQVKSNVRENDESIIKQIEVDSNDLLNLEKRLSKKSNEEILKAIEENNKWAEKESFIVRANDHQLDEIATKKFVKYIRLNNVLHKILIDREIEEMERNEI